MRFVIRFFVFGKITLAAGRERIEMAKGWRGERLHRQNIQHDSGLDCK